MPEDQELEPKEEEKQEEPSPEDERELEEKAVEARGEKLVPLAALKEERAKRREISQKLSSLQEQVKKYQELEGHWRKVEPYIHLLESRPDVLEYILGKEKGGAEEKEEDPEAVEIAEALGLYTEDGSPDTKRAGKIAKLLERRAEKIASEKIQKEVEPVRKTTLQDRAAMLRARAYEAKDESGRAFAKRENIDKVLDLLPIELQAEPSVVNLALVLARGLGAAPPEREEPVFSESSGGRRPGSTPLSRIEESAAKIRGISLDQWRKLRDREGDVLE